MVQTARVYVKNNIKADWDDIDDILVHTFNKYKYFTGKVTLFDSKSLESSLYTKSNDWVDWAITGWTNKAIVWAHPIMWRRDFIRQRAIALMLARKYQVRTNARRPQYHNEGWHRPNDKLSREIGNQIIFMQQFSKLREDMRHSRPVLTKWIKYGCSFGKWILKWRMRWLI